MNVLKILKPGLFTTVQDEGRPGYMKYGVPLCGALDLRSMRAANAAVGNAQECAVLEITMTGPEIEMVDDCKIAVAGASFDLMIDGRPKEASSFGMKKGQILKFGRLFAGCRSYLAVSGGIDVPLVLGSRSTYVQGAFGGIEGRALRAGDIIRTLKSKNDSPTAFRAADEIPSLEDIRHIRVVPAAEYQSFPEASRERFLNTVWTAAAESNRMGIRIASSDTMKRASLTGQQIGNMITTGVMPGSVQIPPDGAPIIIMRDGQTTGGYPRIVHVRERDLNELAQVRGGGKILFKMDV